MFFDTNEIHIQAFLLFINGKLFIFQSSSPQNYFGDIYSKNISKKLSPRTLLVFMENHPFENFSPHTLLVFMENHGFELLGFSGFLGGFSHWGGGNLYVEGEPRTNRKTNVR